LRHGARRSEADEKVLDADHWRYYRFFTTVAGMGGAGKPASFVVSGKKQRMPI
jgi:hypothetical protein